MDEPGFCIWSILFLVTRPNLCRFLHPLLMKDGKRTVRRNSIPLTYEPIRNNAAFKVWRVLCNWQQSTEQAKTGKAAKPSLPSPLCLTGQIGYIQCMCLLGQSYFVPPYAKCVSPSNKIWQWKIFFDGSYRELRMLKIIVIKAHLDTSCILKTDAVKLRYPFPFTTDWW